MDLLKFDYYRKLQQWYQQWKELLHSLVEITDPAASLTKNTETNNSKTNDTSIISTYTELDLSTWIHGKNILLNKTLRTRINIVLYNLNGPSYSFIRKF